MLGARPRGHDALPPAARAHHALAPDRPAQRPAPPRGLLCDASAVNQRRPGRTRHHAGQGGGLCAAPPRVRRAGAPPAALEPIPLVALLCHVLGQVVREAHAARAAPLHSSATRAWRARDGARGARAVLAAHSLHPPAAVARGVRACAQALLAPLLTIARAWIRHASAHLDHGDARRPSRRRRGQAHPRTDRALLGLPGRPSRATPGSSL